MFIENIKVEFVAVYQIAGKKKTDKPTQHETSFGTLVLEVGLPSDEIDKIIEPILASFGDYVEARITMMTSNL